MPRYVRTKGRTDPGPRLERSDRGLEYLLRFGQGDTAAVASLTAGPATPARAELIQATIAAVRVAATEFANANSRSDASTTETGFRRDGETVNDAMMRQFVLDKRCVQWPANQWRQLMDCTKTAVITTPAWKAIMQERQDRCEALKKGGYRGKAGYRLKGTNKRIESSKLPMQCF